MSFHPKVKSRAPLPVPGAQDPGGVAEKQSHRLHKPARLQQAAIANIPTRQWLHDVKANLEDYTSFDVACTRGKKHRNARCSIIGTAGLERIDSGLQDLPWLLLAPEHCRRGTTVPMVGGLSSGGLYESVTKPESMASSLSLFAGKVENLPRFPDRVQSVTQGPLVIGLPPV
jgi:hypothetical protein